MSRPGALWRTLHHYSSQYPVDSRLGPLDLNQSTTSVSTRNQILRLRGRFQRDSALPSFSASNNRSSSTDACSSISFPGRDRAFRRFAFLLLAVMTQSYALHRHDVTFLQEHCGSRGELPLLQFLEAPREELPLWFLLGQRQRFLIRRPSLGCPAEPAVHIGAGGMRQVIICQVALFS
jgi:hypothetical protein